MEGIRQDTRLIVTRLEGQVARLRAAVWILFLIVVAAASALAWQHLHPKAAPSAATVKELIVEDGDGSARVLITGHGISLMDGQGQPRADLSLDAKGGAHLALRDAQNASALMGADGLMIKDAKKDAAVMTTAGGATIQLRRDDKVVFKQPWDAQELK